MVRYTKEDFLEIYESIDKATKYKIKGSEEIINAIEFKSRGLDKDDVINWINPIEETKPLMDAHDHLIVDHDLFNHEGLTQDGIAEAFNEFAKKEKFSFAGK
jgi:type I restriction enzyme M protein